MSAKNNSAGGSSDREIVISRAFAAPRELVWEAWTNPEHVAQWWGPKGFTTTIAEMDVRPGGVWRHVMHGPDGTDYPNHSVFTEVVKPERIVFSHGGGKQGAPEINFTSTWTFEQEGDQTRLTVRMVFPSAAIREKCAVEYGAIEGGHQTLARLSEQLPKMAALVREVVITRLIDAPRELVFRAWTESSRMAQWWGPKGFTNPICELDPRVGGGWRIVMRSPDGVDYPCGGVYREIVKPERLVFTNDARDQDGKTVLEGLTKVTFTDQGGKTKLMLQTRALARVAYAVAYLEGMEAGWSQSLERLAACSAKT